MNQAQAYEAEQDTYSRLEEVTQKHDCLMCTREPDYINEWTMLYVQHEPTGMVYALEWDEDEKGFEVDLIEQLGKAVGDDN